jgi:hypothetical protein
MLADTGEALSENEGIVYAEIDTSRSVEPKQFQDLTGYYNRFDIFDLRVDRSAHDPARFLERPEKRIPAPSDAEGAHEDPAVASFRESSSESAPRTATPVLRSSLL